MKFPFTSIFLLGILFLGMTFLGCNTKPKAATKAPLKEQKTYTLTVERGAFHYDSFVLEADTLSYIPQEKSDHAKALYNTPSSKTLDNSVTNRFLTKIVEDGFWELNSTYKSANSCNSQLRITLANDERYKTVTCDDFESDCPKLIKYIDQKIVELEGNGLVRIYLPG